MKQPLICIVGPTATGKSDTAIEVASALNSSVISADSAQVYKGMNIGTAKVMPDERVSADGKYVNHYMIDIVNPDVDYNINLFQREARKIIGSLHQEDKTPVLCGGSGLYVNAVVNESYILGEDEANPDQREKLMSLEQEKGEGYLHKLLSEKFPKRAAKISPKDYQRILRALERKTDLTEEEEAARWNSPYAVKMFGLNADRQILYNRIEARVDRMFDNGLVDEVQALLECGYDEKCNALSAIGYKEVIPYLKGEYNLQTAKELLKRNTRHFAKRQLTWFRRDPRIIWLDIREYPSAKEVSKKILSTI